MQNVENNMEIKSDTQEPSDRPFPQALAPVNRDSAGKFINGNQAAVGHSTRREKMQKLCDQVLATVTEKHIAVLVQVLLRKALNGDISAAKEILDRCCGKPTLPIDIEERKDLVIRIGLKLPIDPDTGLEMDI